MAEFRLLTRCIDEHGYWYVFLWNFRTGTYGWRRLVQDA